MIAHCFSFSFWLEVGIDGWRLDCASDIAPEFWTGFREVCTNARADSVLIGEIIHGEDSHKNRLSASHPASSPASKTA